ncbi:MAG: methyltransferase domain-containing protein, partial [Alphaproteobacteria bacterium]|nr:methyltransferase domain-containing protein [Alphaproteobacteria bacterium]
TKQYEKTIQLHPAHPDALTNLANILCARDERARAAALYERALRIAPNSVEALFGYGACLCDLGRPIEGFAVHRRLVRLKPTTPAFWVAATESLARCVFPAVDDDLLEDVGRILASPVCDGGYVSDAVVGALVHTPAKAVFDPRGVAQGECLPLARELSRIPLFLQLLSNAIVPNPYLEKALIRMRRTMLLERVEDDAFIPFAMALAFQCYFNEYVYPADAGETARVLEIKSDLAQDGIPSAMTVCLLACYEPLAALADADRLLALPFADNLHALLKMQFLEPREEQGLRGEIPRLTIIDDETSKAVRRQYEANPYPRWTTALFHAEPKTVKAVLSELPLDLRPVHSFPSAPDVLIAGCGTGKHAIRTHSRFRHNSLLAIDLSLSSLAYARRKAREFGASDIEFAHADILNLGVLERRFDIIESSGVLHHMQDPEAGWRVLAGLLKPGGLMRVALYSERARADIVAIRQRIAEGGFTASPDHIRAFRAGLINRFCDTGGLDGLNGELLNARDFYALSDCRDLLFHVQEHRFTLPQIDAILNRLGLTFLGFELPDADAVRDFRRLNRQPGALASLDRWDRFERDRPGLFRGMYQFWCARLH